MAAPGRLPPREPQPPRHARYAGASAGRSRGRSLNPAAVQVAPLSYWHDSLEGRTTTGVRVRRCRETPTSTSPSSALGSRASGPRTPLAGRPEPSGDAHRARSQAGFGASGRNGGWCVGDPAAPLPALEKVAGREAAIAMAHELHRTVDEVGIVSGTRGDRLRLRQGGRDPARAPGRQQLARLEHLHRVQSPVVASATTTRMLTPSATAEIVRAEGVLGGMFTPRTRRRCTPLASPGGLALAVERLGGVVHEGTAVFRRSSSDELRTERRHRAQRRVVDPRHGGLHRQPRGAGAGEGAGRELHDRHRAHRRGGVGGDRPGGTERCSRTSRTCSPMASAPPRDRIAVGRAGRSVVVALPHPTVADDRPSGGRRDCGHDWSSRFPVLEGIAVTHHWGGVLGVPARSPSRGRHRPGDRAWRGLGGYGGAGVAASNEAGRALADLISGDGQRPRPLPWANHENRPWEPEPLRWLGVHAVASMAQVADRVDAWRS